MQHCTPKTLLLALQSERSVRKDNNIKVKELEQALEEARSELQAEKLLLLQVTTMRTAHSLKYSGCIGCSTLCIVCMLRCC